MSFRDRNVSKKIGGFLISSSGTSVLAVGYLLVAAISSLNSQIVSVFLLILSYMFATSTVIGHVTGPNFLLNKNQQNVHHVVASNIFILSITSALIFTYNLFSQLIEAQYILLAVFVVLSQIITPFWLSVPDSRCPNKFAYLSIARVLALILVVALSSARAFELNSGLWGFCVFAVFSALYCGGAKLILNMFSTYRNMLKGAVAYMLNVKALFMTLQMNLFVAYLMPLICLPLIEPDQIHFFYMADRSRYIALAIVNSIFIYWQRHLIYHQNDYEFLEKCRSHVKRFSALVAVAFCSVLVVLKFGLIISDYQLTVGICIGIAASIGVIGTYLTNVELVVSQAYSVIFKANAYSLIIYAVIGFSSVLFLGSLGLAIAAIVLESSILLQLFHRSSSIGIRVGWDDAR